MMYYGTGEVSCGQNVWEDEPHTTVSKPPASKYCKYERSEYRDLEACTTKGWGNKEHASRCWRSPPAAVAPKKPLQRSRSSHCLHGPATHKDSETALLTISTAQSTKQVTHRNLPEDPARPETAICPHTHLNCLWSIMAFPYPPSNPHGQTVVWNCSGKGALGNKVPSSSSVRTSMWMVAISSRHQTTQLITVSHACWIHEYVNLNFHPWILWSNHNFI